MTGLAFRNVDASPDDPVAAHLSAAMTGVTTPRAPRG